MRSSEAVLSDRPMVPVSSAARTIAIKLTPNVRGHRCIASESGTIVGGIAAALVLPLFQAGQVVSS